MEHWGITTDAERDEYALDALLRGRDPDIRDIMQGPPVYFKSKRERCEAEWERAFSLLAFTRQPEEDPFEPIFYEKEFYRDGVIVKREAGMYRGGTS